MEGNCKQCHKTQNKLFRFKNTSYLSAILVIIIPNCPFCVMAYSSAITMCGGPDMYLESNNWVSYIPLFLSAFILGVILYNNRGIRTFYAFLVALTGFLLILLSHQLMIPAEFFNWGTMLLFLAIWMNSSLLSFLETVKGWLNNTINTWQK